MSLLNVLETFEFTIFVRTFFQCSKLRLDSSLQGLMATEIQDKAIEYQQFSWHEIDDFIV